MEVQQSKQDQLSVISTIKVGLSPSEKKIVICFNANRTIAPWKIAPQIITPRTITPQDNCPPDNCPPKIASPEIVPQIISPWATGAQAISPQNNIDY